MFIVICCLLLLSAGRRRNDMNDKRFALQTKYSYFLFCKSYMMKVSQNMFSFYKTIYLKWFVSSFLVIGVWLLMPELRR